MANVDYLGARASNAGDRFHELWVLRQAMVLFDEITDLTAITVEGLTAEDESGATAGTWDGVDCTLYYGGYNSSSASRIDLVQVKYSTANPEQTWTVARLCHSSNKQHNNSVIGKLAKAFCGVRSLRSELVDSGKVRVRFISNQPVTTEVLDALVILGNPDKPYSITEECQSQLVAIRNASGLSKEDIILFALHLDFSECEHESRFALEERVIQTISEWTDENAHAHVENLIDFVRRAMLPEGKGKVITRESILVQLGFTDPQALFPCPDKTSKVDKLVPREVTRTIVGNLNNGEQHLLLHGEAGCGKSTVVQEIETLLPLGSVLIRFDCYGGGGYLNSNAYRHRPQEAFVQLSNDLARKLRMPLLLGQAERHDYPKSFMKWLERGADVVTAMSHEALLVIAIDAADNAIAAAALQLPVEKCFIFDFMSLGELPNNVRFIMTMRTGRLADLGAKSYLFKQIEIPEFSLTETATKVRGIWEDATDDWIDFFHHLTSHNPRVQQYALNRAGSDASKAIDFLLPNGKGLEQIFQDQIERARSKVGEEQDIWSVCAALVELPRPIPIGYLSAVTGLHISLTRDICLDLAPGLRLNGDFISFADEDFEHFLRNKASIENNATIIQIANYLCDRHLSDTYAAVHVAGALYKANRRRELLDLVRPEHTPTVITDPVLRREVQLQRHKIAMKVCLETDNAVDATMTLLYGADALKSDAVIQRILVENPDLAACFAWDIANRKVLYDATKVENHGPLLLHLMATAAQEGNSALVQSELRQFDAWLEHRQQNIEQQQREHPDIRARGWDIYARDIAAETEALLRVFGPQKAKETLLLWRPRTIATRVAAILSCKLITSRESALVEQCLVEGGVRSPWDLFMLVPIALSGKEVDISRLERSLSRLYRRGLIHPEQLRETWDDENESMTYFDTILTACEVTIARGGNHEVVIPVLELLADREYRRTDRLSTSQVSLIDISLRSYALLERIAGREVTTGSYLIDSPKPQGESSDPNATKSRNGDDEKNKELNNFLDLFIPFYNIRAHALVGTISPPDTHEQLLAGINRYNRDRYRESFDYHIHGMKRRVALSITRLVVIPGINQVDLLQDVESLLGSQLIALNTFEEQVYANLALDETLHTQILKSIGTRVKTIKELRVSTEEKISALVKLSRLLIPISRPDAESLFTDIFEIAGGINADAVYEIAIFEPIVKQAVANMGNDQRKELAKNLAVVISDASIRLEV